MNRLAISFGSCAISATIIPRRIRARYSLPPRPGKSEPAGESRLSAPVACCSPDLLGYVFRPVGQHIGNYRYTPISRDARAQVWSPDGRAFAYASTVNGTAQVFLRYLNSPVPIQLTHEKDWVFPKGWSSDGSHVIVAQFTGGKGPAQFKLSSVATVGGNLEFIMYFDCDNACDVSPDGKLFATHAKDTDGNYVVEASDPLGSPLRAYMPAPFATEGCDGNPQLAFSRDGKKILLYCGGDEKTGGAWLLPYPAGGKPPNRVLQKMPVAQFLEGSPSFSWLPDNRHIVVSLVTDEKNSSHLWIADTESNDLMPLTTGPSRDLFPVVSPDGKSILYDQDASHYDVVSVSVEDGSAKTLISTGYDEVMPAWSANQAKLVWVTDRSGPGEIWVRSSEGSDRPVVTAADFPAGTNKWFGNPSLSPDGDRVIYSRLDRAGVARLWISSLSGGAPVRLTNTEGSFEPGGSWSPDGSRFVYLQNQAGKASLMMVKTSGNAAPAVLRENVMYVLPNWSPVGDWITFRDDKGWNLISPDGKTTQFLGKIETRFLAFSKDGKLLYGIQWSETEGDQDRFSLFSLDPVKLKQKIIRELSTDFWPASPWSAGVRFSLAPDGMSFVYGTHNERMDLWMLQGYRQPGWLGRISDALNLK
jgi:Tol biopolymer transport system component